MAAVIIGTDTETLPLAFGGVIIETKATWDDDWAAQDDLTLSSLGVYASSSENSTCEFERRYGNAAFPGETDLSIRETLDLKGYWVRVKFTATTGGGAVTQFVGIVQDKANTVYGDAPILSGGDNVAQGHQHWIAQGGLEILKKVQISQSIFLNTDSVQLTMDWIPSMNRKDRRGLVVGNKNDADGGEEAGDFYGGSTLWDHGAYVQYLIDNFIQQDDGPEWTISGLTDVLGDMKDTIDFSDVETAAAMLKKLIPVKYGLDYMVTPTADGFDITVFSLLAADLTVGGVTMPANPNTMEIISENVIEMEPPRLVLSDAHLVDTVNVVGKRIVVCGTLRAARMTAGNSPATAPGDPDGASLVPKWTYALENDYISAGGLVTSDPNAGTIKFDNARRREKYREVYQHFGAPVGWDGQEGEWAVMMATDGTLNTGDFQESVRETLAWIPLKEGWDYSTSTPVDNTLGNEEQIKPPMAWIYDEAPEEGDPRFFQAEFVGLHTNHPYHDFGLIVNGSPNHVVALNHWTDAQLDTSDLQFLRYDFDTLLATIAIESDHRLAMTYSVPDEMAAGDGSMETIYDEEAELWVLLPSTVIDVDASGVLVASPNTMQILRNDRSRIALTLCGAVARYANERIKMDITFRTIQPWALYVGYILTVTQNDESITPTATPITSIEFNLHPSPTMSMKCGYA